MFHTGGEEEKEFFGRFVGIGNVIDKQKGHYHVWGQVPPSPRD
jgi:hypothetical protein